MKNKDMLTLGVVLAVGIIALYLWYPAQKATGEFDAFARCLADKKITMYGADWCLHCQNEKKAFGTSFRLVPYVECPSDPKKCLTAGIDGYPTWVFPDGRKLVGEQGLETLSQESGCALTSGTSTPPAARVETVGGVELPAVWGDLGAKLISVGAIDAERFKSLYDERGVFTDEYRRLLFGTDNGKLILTKENAGYLLNMLWALGLANKNPILDSGEMQNPAYGGAENFASTAGWTMAKGAAMDHYSRHKFFTLTPRQQAMVDTLSRNIYRPCCRNSTHFPDCNHGMAMLGLLELMAAQGVDEDAMQKAALTINTYWFPGSTFTGCTVGAETRVEPVPQPIAPTLHSGAQSGCEI